MNTRSFLRGVPVRASVAILAGATLAAAQETPPSPDFSTLLQGLVQGANQQKQNAPALINFRDLKAQLPPELPDMKRTSASGEKTGAFGMSVAFAEATYRSEDGGTISIKITDSGGMGGFAAMAQAGFAASEIDRETETGYERSTTIKGYRGMEQYDSRRQSGSVMFMAKKRLSFEIKGRKAPMEKIKGVDASSLPQCKATLIEKIKRAKHCFISLETCKYCQPFVLFPRGPWLVY